MPFRIGREVSRFEEERAHALGDAIDATERLLRVGQTGGDLHELFDSVSEEVEGFVDTVAERLVALGGTPEGTIGVVAKRTKLETYPVNINSGRAHVEALSNAMAAVGKSVRAAIDQANELGDADTADLFTEVSRAIDKKLWFVEAHLHGKE